MGMEPVGADQRAWPCSKNLWKPGRSFPCRTFTRWTLAEFVSGAKLQLPPRQAVA